MSIQIPYGQHLVIDEFLEPGSYQALLHFSKNLQLLHGWKNRVDSPRDFWHRNFVLPGTYLNHYDPQAVNSQMNYKNFLASQPPELVKVAEKIRNELFMGVEFTRVWINVQTFGDEGDLHRDFPIEFKATARAAILYLQDQWDVAWGGDLALFDDQNEISSCIRVKPNRLVLFNGCQTHSARPISRFCTEPRRSLVFACEVV